MALVKMKDLLLRAQKENKGCGAFSVGNMEMVKGAIKAAEELDTPIILQIAEVRLDHSPLHLMGPMMLEAARNAKVDVAVHLDHGLKFETIKKALEYGFTSVMLDASRDSFEENIEKTEKEIIKQLEDIKNGEFSGEDISNSVLSIINSLKGVGDTSTSYINWYFGCLANGELLEPSESVEKIKAVTRERIIEAAKSFELDTVYVMRGE